MGEGVLALLLLCLESGELVRVGIDGVALSITHLSGRVTSSHFIFLGRDMLAFVISVINKVVSPF